MIAAENELWLIRDLFCDALLRHPSAEDRQVEDRQVENCLVLAVVRVCFKEAGCLMCGSELGSQEPVKLLTVDFCMWLHLLPHMPKPPVKSVVVRFCALSKELAVRHRFSHAV